jgi:prenyltransferase beta subunit
VGGFGKGVGDPPGMNAVLVFGLRASADLGFSSDVLHAYLGLASLALIERSDLERVDPTFCISERARSNLSRVLWWKD